jgi:hypothetical protein
MTFAEWPTNCETALTLHFEHLYFISVDTLPTHLTPLFQRQPSWRFFRIRSVADRQQLAQA